MDKNVATSINQREHNFDTFFCIIIMFVLVKPIPKFNMNDEPPKRTYTRHNSIRETKSHSNLTFSPL